MPTWTTLSDSTLAQDKPLTQSITRALRDNPIALAEGASGAPQVEHKAINSGAFSASTTAGGGFSQANGAVVPFSVENFDQNGWFNSSTYRFVPQKPGLYLVSAYVFQGSGGTGSSATFSLRKNGTIFASAAIGAANVSNSALTSLVYLNGSTDYVDVVTTVPSGSLTLGGGGSSWIRGCLAGYTP